MVFYFRAVFFFFLVSFFDQGAQSIIAELLLKQSKTRIHIFSRPSNEFVLFQTRKRLDAAMIFSMFNYQPPLPRNLRPSQIDFSKIM